MHACEHAHAAHAHSEKEIGTSIYAFYTPRFHKVRSVSSQEIQLRVGGRLTAMKSILLVFGDLVERTQRHPVDGLLVSLCLHFYHAAFIC